MRLLMPRPISIGVDLATAHARVVAVDFSNRPSIVAEVSAPLASPTYRDGGYARQLPSYDLVVLDLLEQLVSILGPRRVEVGAVSVTGTSGTVLGVDRQGKALGEALLYSDSSGSGFDEVLARYDHQGRPTASLNRMAVIFREHSPTRIVTSADVVNQLLTGNHSVPSDTSHTLKAAVDTELAAWPGETLDALGVPPEVLPELVNPGEVLGPIGTQLAAELGLPPDALVVAGMTDGCTSHIATGALLVGDTVGVLGTTLVLKAVADHDVRNPALGLYSHRSPDGTFFPGGASNIGGGSLPEGLSAQDIARLTEESVAKGMSPHLVYPLPRPGERFPFSLSTATALGMDRHWGEGELFHATIQAVAMTERLGREVLAGAGVPLARHAVSGGGAGSLAMTMLRATVLGESVTSPHFTDSGVGAAVLAAQAISGMGLTEFSQAHQVPSTEVEPVEHLVAEAEQRYQEFLQMLQDAGYLSS